MHLSRPAAAVAVLACAAGIALSGCANAATGSTDPSSFANVSGSAVAVADDITALCAQIVEQQLSPDAATASAEGSGYTTRIGSVDGEAKPLTMDYREDRMTFTVVDDVVTECLVG